MKYVIIVYKPEFLGIDDETSYDGYFNIIECKDEEETIRKLAEVKSKSDFLNYEEPDYETTVIKGEILFGNDFDTDCIESNNLLNRALVLAKEIIDSKRRKIQERKDEANRRAIEKKELEEREEYLRLKKKYESEDGFNN